MTHKSERKPTIPHTFAAGWNACFDGEMDDPGETDDWRDGYRRCAKINPRERRAFNE